MSVFQDKVCRTNTLWIWQDKHPIAMFYCFMSCRDKVLKIAVFLATYDIDFILAVKEMEFATKSNTLHLTREVCSCQGMQLG